MVFYSPINKYIGENEGRLGTIGVGEEDDVGFFICQHEGEDCDLSTGQTKDDCCKQVIDGMTLECQSNICVKVKASKKEESTIVD